MFFCFIFVFFSPTESDWTRGLLEWHKRIINLFFCSKGREATSCSQHALGQLLSGLHLLLGYFLLRHDGHPRRYRPSDSLLGHVVAVDEGKEAPAAPRTLRGIVAVQSGRHAVALLLQKEATENGKL